MKTTLLTFFLLASAAIAESNLVWAIRADVTPAVYNAITNQLKAKTGDVRAPCFTNSPRWDSGGTRWFVGSANPAVLRLYTNRLIRIDDLPSNARFKAAWVEGEPDAYIVGTWGMTNGVMTE